MKKLLLPVLLGLICAPLSADPDLQEFVRELGYRDDYISENLPAPKAPPKVAPKKQQPVHAEPQRDLMQPEDLLYPRVFQKGESAAMIPVLVRLHRANPTSDKITRKLAVTCLKNGQQREALYWYTQTYHRNRSDFESLWNMASLSYSLGETALTKKYLEEYAKLDPNSAWGRMAREFLAGRFSGADLGDGFEKGIGRVGEPAGGVGGKKASVAPTVSGKSSETGDGILIVEGKRYDVESFVSFYDENTEIEKPTKLNDTLKGKSGTRSSDKKAGKKLSLEKAVVADKAETGAKAPPAAEATKAAPIESAELKATAPPPIPPVASETK